MIDQHPYKEISCRAICLGMYVSIQKFRSLQNSFVIRKEKQQCAVRPSFTLYSNSYMVRESFRKLNYVPKFENCLSTHDMSFQVGRCATSCGNTRLIRFMVTSIMRLLMKSEEELCTVLQSFQFCFAIVNSKYKLMTTDRFTLLMKDNMGRNVNYQQSSMEAYWGFLNQDNNFQQCKR